MKFIISAASNKIPISIRNRVQDIKISSRNNEYGTIDIVDLEDLLRLSSSLGASLVVGRYIGFDEETDRVNGGIVSTIVIYDDYLELE